MDEATLESSIATYKQQLEQVQTVLRSAGTDGQEELLQLRGDLQEVIQLTEESLLSLKKSRLMHYVESGFQEEVAPKEVDVPAAADPMDAEYAAFQQALGVDVFQSDDKPSGASSGDMTKDEGNGDADDGDQDGDDDITGTKCSLMYSHEWGATERHNAIVLSLEPMQDDSGEIFVRVLFCNPTHQSMKPCPFYLEGKCRFTEEDCRFSHGHLIKLSELSEYQEPDFSLLEAGSKCLAKFEKDSLWYPADVESVDTKSHTFAVTFESYGNTETVGADAILHRDFRMYSSSSSSSSSSSEGEEDADLTPSTSAVHRPPDEGDENETPMIAWKAGISGTLGDWEAHTRGIGSKLMAKMGYEFGKGLGKYGQGRVEIVEAFVLPQGKSLDKCMELRAQKKVHMVGGKRKEKHKKKMGGDGHGGTSVKSKQDVFEFINTKLKGRKAKANELLEDTFELIKADRMKLQERRPEPKAGRQLNIQVVKTEEEIRNTEKMIRRLEQSLERNQRDKTMQIQIQGKIADKKRYLQNLKVSEKKLEQQQASRNHHRKLTVF